jgi:hypothetical protein
MRESPSSGAAQVTSISQPLADTLNLSGPSPQLQEKWDYCGLDSLIHPGVTEYVCTQGSMTMCLVEECLSS